MPSQGTVPPQNIEAEQSVLGALMLDKEAMMKVADIVHPDDFYKEAHRLVYESMLELFERRDPIDLLSVSNRMTEKGQLDQIGGKAYLSSLVTSVPAATHVAHYASIIQNKATLRKLIQAGIQISELGYQETEDTVSQLDSAEQKLFAISQKHLKQNFTPIKSALTETFERIDELHKTDGSIRGIPTGYIALDELLAGLQRSDLVILAARPSMGKTTFALDLARHAAVEGKKVVGIFSLEMSKEQLIDRLLASSANVDLWKLRTGKLSDEDFDRLNHAIGTLSEAQIHIDDSPGANVMEIRTKARRLQMEQGLDFLVVDYLQLMEGRNTENRVQEVSEISRALKGIARELNIPVLALSQLSRAVEQRQPQIPQLSDLRESGSIEQDADVVMFIYRESVYDPKTTRRHIAEIHVKKHRNGPTGKVDLFFDENKISFKNLDQRHTSGPEASGMGSSMMPPAPLPPMGGMPGTPGSLPGGMPSAGSMPGMPFPPQSPQVFQ